MGCTGSKIVEKLSQFSSGSNLSARRGPDSSTDASSSSLVHSRGTPFVLYRNGSMYFDEDGDLAHEFYEEAPPPRKGCKATMRRISRNLRPQGPVKYQYPRLHVDFPVILYQG